MIVLGLILGSVLAARWELFLKFTNSVPFNQNDPVYGLDLGFYIFNLPFYSFVQGWVLGLFIVVLLATIALHFINYSMRGVGYELNGPRLIHLSIIAAVIMLAMGVGHWLDRWALVLSEDGYSFGASYTDLNARKPAMLIMTFVAVAAAALMLVNIYVRQLRIVVGAVALWIVLGLVLGTGLALSNTEVHGNTARAGKGVPLHSAEHRDDAAGIRAEPYRRGVLSGSLDRDRGRSDPGQP